MLALIRLLIRLEWPMRVASPLFGRFNPFRPSYRRDPYPTYRALRENAPVYRHPILRSWILTRYADFLLGGWRTSDVAQTPARAEQ